MKCCGTTYRKTKGSKTTTTNMAIKTNIEWADRLQPQPFSAFELTNVARASGLEVLKVVAGAAKCLAVGNVKSKLSEFCEWLNVVGPQVSTLAVTTLLAGVVIAGKNSVPPPSVFSLTPSVLPAFVGSVAPCVMVLPFWGCEECCRRDFSSHFNGPLLTFLWADLPNPGSGHFRLGFSGVALSFERRNAAFPANFHLHPSASSASGIKTVVSRRILAELKGVSPRPAFTAMLQPKASKPSVFSDLDANFFGSNRFGTLSCLTHG